MSTPLRLPAALLRQLAIGLACLGSTAIALGQVAGSYSGLTSEGQAIDLIFIPADANTPEYIWFFPHSYHVNCIGGDGPHAQGGAFYMPRRGTATTIEFGYKDRLRRINGTMRLTDDGDLKGSFLVDSALFADEGTGPVAALRCPTKVIRFSASPVAADGLSLTGPSPRRVTSNHP